MLKGLNLVPFMGVLTLIIEEHQVGGFFPDKFKRFTAILSLAYYLYIRNVFETMSQATTCQGFIIHDQGF